VKTSLSGGFKRRSTRKKKPAARDIIVLVTAVVVAVVVVIQCPFFTTVQMVLKRVQVSLIQALLIHYSAKNFLTVLHVLSISAFASIHNSWIDISIFKTVV
jgi:hypothetical protein